jgi:Rhodanese-like domain
MRWALIAVVACGVLLAGAAPAAPPEYPVTFIKVDELKVLLDLGQKVDIIDVRHWTSYVESHIRGARSIPLRTVGERAKEISKTALAVFY